MTSTLTAPGSAASARSTAIAQGKRAVRAGLYAWNTRGRHVFDDRRRGAGRVLIVLGGYKEALWPYTLPRFERAADPSDDVCLVVAGRDVPALRRRATAAGWSYLSTRGGQVSLALNMAIRLHPQAQVIVKVDEDMFVGPGFVPDLEASWRRTIADGRYEVGMCSPVVNVNTISFEPFVETLGLTEEFTERYGRRRAAAQHVYHDPDAAVWLWRRTLPFEDVAQRFRQQPFAYSLAPSRFSIGAVLFERSTWEMMRTFRRPLEAPGLGVDETHINEKINSDQKVIAIVHDLLAGHFAYGGQEAGVRAAFGDLSAFAPPPV